MGSTAVHPDLPSSVRPYAPQAAVADPDFDSRWAAWIERGRVHEQRVRRRFVIWGPVIAIAAAVAFALFRS